MWPSLLLSSFVQPPPPPRPPCRFGIRQKSPSRGCSTTAPPPSPPHPMQVWHSAEGDHCKAATRPPAARALHVGHPHPQDHCPREVGGGGGCRWVCGGEGYRVHRRVEGGGHGNLVCPTQGRGCMRCEGGEGGAWHLWLLTGTVHCPRMYKRACMQQQQQLPVVIHGSSEITMGGGMLGGNTHTAPSHASHASHVPCPTFRGLFATWWSALYRQYKDPYRTCPPTDCTAPPHALPCPPQVRRHGGQRPHRGATQQKVGALGGWRLVV